METFLNLDYQDPELIFYPQNSDQINQRYGFNPDIYFNFRQSSNSNTSQPHTFGSTESSILIMDNHLTIQQNPALCESSTQNIMPMYLNQVYEFDPAIFIDNVLDPMPCDKLSTPQTFTQQEQTEIYSSTKTKQTESVVTYFIHEANNLTPNNYQTNNHFRQCIFVDHERGETDLVIVKDIYKKKETNYDRNLFKLSTHPNGASKPTKMKAKRNSNLNKK
jgi:hypothetical protein